MDDFPRQRRNVFITSIGFAAAIFFVATLSPLLGFIPLFTFWYTYVADHYQYMASIGPIALMSAGATQLLRDHTSLGKVSLGSAAVLVSLLS